MPDAREKKTEIEKEAREYADLEWANEFGPSVDFRTTEEWHNSRVAYYDGIRRGLELALEVVTFAQNDLARVVASDLHDLQTRANAQLKHRAVVGLSENINLLVDPARK